MSSISIESTVLPSLTRLRVQGDHKGTLSNMFNGSWCHGGKRYSLCDFQLPCPDTLIMLRTEATGIAKVRYLFHQSTQRRLKYYDYFFESFTRYTSRRAKGIDTCFIGVDGYLDKEERQVHSFCMLESNEVSAPYAFAVLTELYFPPSKKKEALIFLCF